MFRWIFPNVSNHKQAECLKKSNQKSGYDFKQIFRKPEIVLFCTLAVLSVLRVINLLCANCPLNYFVFHLHGGTENNFSSSVAFSNDQYNCATPLQPQLFVSFRKKFLTWKKAQLYWFLSVQISRHLGKMRLLKSIEVLGETRGRTIFSWRSEPIISQHYKQTKILTSFIIH